MIIGLTGKAGSGKDTVADFLVEYYGFTKYSLASPIKRGIASMFGVSEEFLDDRALKESPREELCNRSYRELATTLGTEWGRVVLGGEVPIWVKLANRFINAHPDEDIVIPDIRFDNEVENLDVLLMVTRNVSTSVNHISEAGVSAGLIDCTIRNNGTKLELYNAVNKIMGEYCEN